MTAFYFGRDYEINECWRLLTQGRKLLLLGPRRIGKTQLCHQLRARAEQANWPHFFVDIGGCEDEEQVVSLIEQETSNWWQKSVSLLHRSNIKIENVGEMQVQALSWEQRGLARFKNLAAENKPALLVLDEVPVFLQRLLRDNVKRAERWLQAFRSWQQDADHLRLIVAGSIGLNTLTQRHRLTTGINNLLTFTLEAFSDNDAVSLIQALAKHKGRAIAPAAQTRLMEIVGWHVPYYYDELIEASLQARKTAALNDANDVDAGLERLLANAGSFLSHWHDRLSDHGHAEADQLRKMLSRIARAETGCDRATLGGVRDEQIDYFLSLLGDEGYTATSPTNPQIFVFRSGLVRQWWLRKGLRR
jgi:uncharacterized protein